MTDHDDDHLRSRVNGIHPSAYAALRAIGEFDDQTGKQILVEILRFCCHSQNVAAIAAGQRAFAQISESWLGEHLAEVAESALNLNDEWEYRRFLELLHEVKSPQFESFCAVGYTSGNPEVREAAADMASLDDL